jgi:hypothetical protein
MIFEFRLAAIVPQMSAAVVECIHSEVGAPLKVGHKLLDLSVDLSSAFAQECPPVSFFRMVLREPAWLRRLDVVLGQSCQLGELMALFSSEKTEDLDQASQRPVRTTVAGIVHHEGMWTGNYL